MAIDNEDLAKAVSKELDNAETWMNSELAGEQAESLEYYYREPFGNERNGYSQVVTADVMETIEGIMPELMKIFTSGDTVVEFQPNDAGDMAGAEQATDYLNYIFLNRMDGFKILYDWFKDALLMKNGLVKVGWEEIPDVQFHNFSYISQEQIDIIEAEEEVTDIEIEETDLDNLFDVKVKRVLDMGKPYVETIPSENFKIKERSRSIAESDFHAVVCDRSVGDLIAAGYDEEDLEEGIGANDDSTQVESARFSSPSEGTRDTPTTNVSDYDRMVEVIEAYIRAYDEDHKATVLLKVIQVGGTVLEQEEVTRSPYISLSPIMMPHKYTGIAVADLVKDIQEIKSSMYRNMLDNMAIQNAGRYAAVEGQANLQDLLDNKIGGVVRMKAQGAVQRLDTPQLSPFTIPLLEKLDDLGERRVGVSKMSNGLDPNALTSHTGSQQLHQVMSAAQQKILLIARVFAETGVKDLFRYLYEESRTHNTKNDIVKLRGQWVAVRPFDWVERKDMQVTVGIGNGNKDQQLAHLQGIGQMLQMIGNTQYAYLIGAEHVHHYASEFIKNSGYKNPDSFIANPATTQAPEAQPDAAMVEAQGEAQKDAAHAAKLQAETQAIPKELQLKEQELMLKAEAQAWQKKVDAAETMLEADQKRAVGIGPN